MSLSRPNQVPGLPEGFYYGVGTRTSEGLSVPVIDPHGIEICTVTGYGWVEINEKAAPRVKAIIRGAIDLVDELRKDES